MIALWTKSSVASPNVRHEAIIAREAGKLLPVMVDELKPTDFPMGLFMVQALLIGAQRARVQRGPGQVSRRGRGPDRRGRCDARGGGTARRGAREAPPPRC